MKLALIYPLAALAEIGGCFAFWAWLKLDRSPVWLVPGVVSLIAFRTPALLMRLILWPPAIDRHRQYDRLVTYGFIHADFWHLFFNMFTLFFFGRQIEGWMAAQKGPWVFPLFYFSALVVSILPTYLKHQKDPNYRSLGASGAASRASISARSKTALTRPACHGTSE